MLMLNKQIIKLLKNKIIITKSNIKIYFLASLFIYIISISTYLLVSYNLSEKELNNEINQKLIKAAKSIEYLLPINYHDRATNRKAISEIEFREIMQLLSNHADNIGVNYVYSVVESNGKFYFTSSSATSYELKTGQNLSYYWQEYTEANQMFFNALSSNKITYIDYTDRWGTFRSVLIPKTSLTGNKYLLCADIEISYIDKKLWNNLLFIFIKAIFFTFIVIPIFWVLYKYHNLLKEQYIIKISEKELKAIHEQDLRKQSYQKFQQIEEKYSLLLNNIMVPVIILDKYGKIFEANNKFIDFVGKTNSIVENNIIFTIPFFQSVSEFEKLASLTDEKKAVLNYSMKLLTKKGEIDCKVHAFLLENQPNKQYLIIIEDNSTENMYLQELAKAKLFVEELLQRKSIFISSLSHEMRTPLNVIIGFIDIIKNDTLDSKTKEEYLDIIQTNAEHLLLLLNDVIDFSKIEAGQFVLKETQCNLNFLINQFKLWLEEEVKRKKLSIEIKVKKSLDDENAIIYIDELRLKQVLTNLLFNSLKFTQDGYIEFGYEIIENEIKFYVKDTGPGLSEDDKKILFNYYAQGIEGKKSKYKGSGLGLSISKRIVEMMGGNINVISSIDEGSTFYFVLPFKKIPKVDDNNKLHNKNWNGIKFVVADQDKSSNEFIKRIIISYNGEVNIVNNQEEIIEVIENNSDIKFIIFDMDFPITNVAQFIAYVKSKNAMKLIGISSNIYLINVNKKNNIGFDAILAKPFTKKEFEQVIEKLL